MAKTKKKYDLVATLHVIERFHRRRTWLAIHATFSLAFQAAMWINWYSSYAARGVGFERDFFADRFNISMVMCILLVGHWVAMHLMESRDRFVLQLLQQAQSADDSYQLQDDQETLLAEIYPDSGDVGLATQHNVRR